MYPWLLVPIICLINIDVGFYSISLGLEKEYQILEYKQDHTKGGGASNCSPTLKIVKWLMEEKVRLSMFLLGFQVLMIAYEIRVIIKIM